MKFRKKIASLVGLVVATVIGAAALAPTANAYTGDAGFISDVESAGFYNANGNYLMLGQGHWMCNSIAAGWRPLAVASAFWLSTNVNATGAAQFLGYSVADLCPQYAYLTYADVVTEVAISNYQGPSPRYLV